MIFQRWWISLDPKDMGNDSQFDGCASFSTLVATNHQLDCRFHCVNCIATELPPGKQRPEEMMAVTGNRW